MSLLDDLLRRQLDPIPTSWPESPLRHAAVLCPVVERDGKDQLLFAVRPANLRRHAGQVGFPGGMQDPGEPPVQTALRECEEEIGAPATAVTMLGTLPSRESSSHIMVSCLVARLQPVDLVLAPDEVERVLYAPVADLRDESRWQDRAPLVRVAGTPARKSPHFALGDTMLWGLTARFVRDLVARLSNA